MWSELLPGVEVWWGVTRAYWERKDHAFFPAAFTPTLEWSRRFAETALRWAERQNANLYFMPILVDLVEWLTGVLRGPQLAPPSSQ